MRAAAPFIRDRVTWLAYCMLAYLAYMQGALGPLMPFIRQDRRLTYTLGGFLTAALAVGIIIAGLSSDTIAVRLGRRRMFWLGGTGLALGAAGLALSPNFPLMFAFALLMGLSSSLTLATIQAILSDHHGDRRTTALTESNVAASLSASLAPLCIGAFQRLGAGWQSALFVPAFGLVLMLVRFYREPIPSAASQGGSARATRRAELPSAYWAYWIVICLVLSIEWCLVVWGADFLETIAGLSKVNASTAMGVFLGAMLLGRFIGSTLTRRAPATTLLLLALGVTSAGFPLFWLARPPGLNLAGLFVAGLGVANLFPFTLSIAVGLAADQADTASARVSLGVGVAILLAPLALGAAADRLGLPAAYSVVAALLVIAFAVTSLARRMPVKPAAVLPA